eukprot:TRINITY_DN2503_c0_g3_i3.p1 TRINITY_DN2503_c0_g3~~TRINITY_DN2503_c0_g3_i3.p1  ORF type:complete len:122 (+),score=27.50 TRINITY_DN2503_c0_g3_i3:454-819(+)
MPAGSVQLDTALTNAVTEISNTIPAHCSQLESALSGPFASLREMLHKKVLVRDKLEKLKRICHQQYETIKQHTQVTDPIQQRARELYHRAREPLNRLNTLIRQAEEVLGTPRSDNVIRIDT